MRPALSLIFVLAAGAARAQDPEATLVVSDVMVREGNEAVFEVTLAGDARGRVVVHWATEDLTAEAGSDYQGAGGALEFDGPGPLTIKVKVTADTDAEGDEVFFVRLSSPANAAIVDALGHGVISDYNDLGPRRAKCDLDGDSRSNLMVYYPDAHHHSQPDRHEPRHEDWGTGGTLTWPTGNPMLYHEDEEDWTLVAMDDFDGNQTCDLFWARGDEVIFTWTRPGERPRAPHLPGDGPSQPWPGPGWHRVGSGRFNADDRADLLWWDPSAHTLHVWLMTAAGTFDVQELPPVTSGDSLVEPLAVVDLDGDGGAGILWRNTAGVLVYWSMNGLELAHEYRIGPFPVDETGPWALAAVGDFNGDGTEDLIWQARTRPAAVWFMRDLVHLAASPMSPEILVSGGEAGIIRGPR
jgi:hypothetical protein